MNESNLPPGVRESDLPGNRPEDMRFDAWTDHIEVIRDLPRSPDGQDVDIYICRDCLPLVGEPPTVAALDRAIMIGMGEVSTHYWRFHES